MMNFENNPEKKKRPFELEEKDVEFETMRGSGPGGQGADTSSSAVRLRVKVDDLPINEKEKKFIKENVEPHHKDNDGEEILIRNGEERSQEENKQKALEIANKELKEAVEKGYKQEKHEEWKKEHQKRKKKSSSGSTSSKKAKEKKKQKYPEAKTKEDYLKRAEEETVEEDKFEDFE
ncbi:MAG: peptide chain release factor-like protein [Candidatus Magasanikbacteria bacterium]